MGSPALFPFQGTGTASYQRPDGLPGLLPEHHTGWEDPCGHRTDKAMPMPKDHFHRGARAL